MLFAMGDCRSPPLEHCAGEERTARLASATQCQAGALALTCEPELVFADETTGNLDTKTGEAVAALLFRIAGEQGSTLCLVTHDQALAARADRTVKMLDGQLH